MDSAFASDCIDDPSILVPFPSTVVGLACYQTLPEFHQNTSGQVEIDIVTSNLAQYDGPFPRFFLLFCKPQEKSINILQSRTALYCRHLVFLLDDNILVINSFFQLNVN